MPRPIPPSNPAWVTLSDDGYEEDWKCWRLSRLHATHIASIVGLNIDSDEFQRIALSIEHIVDWYFIKSEEPPPSKIVAGMKRIESAMDQLIAELTSVDYFTNEALFTGNFYDGEWAESLEEALETLQRLRETYEQVAPPGRPKNRWLGGLVQYLKWDLQKQLSETDIDWRSYVHAVLAAAEINHPDPDEQRSRFDALLKDHGGGS